MIRCPDCAAPTRLGAKTCPGCGRALSIPQRPQNRARPDRPEQWASALTTRIVAILIVLYGLAVVGYFIYDHLL